MLRAPSTHAASERTSSRTLAARLLASIVITITASVAQAQAILVAPQGVVLTNRERTGTVELYNPSARAAEITLSSAYGHPTTTPEGDLTLVIIEHPDSTAPSAAGFVEAFPRRLILQPNQRQTVRLLARPPQGLTDGEYWARLIVSSRDAAPLAASALDSSVVTVGLSLEVRTIIAVNYRSGAQETGVRLGEITAMPRPDSLVIRAPMHRTGTAAWIGTTIVSLIDASGAVVARQSLQTAVYQTISPRFAFDRRTLKPGPYRVTVDLNTDRPDVIQRTLLKSPPQHAEITVMLATGGAG